MEQSTSVQTVENFFGVYLLYSMNPRYKGRTYIGFTVDPNRRIKQHNKGRQAGGASKTSNRGPWVMVLIVHGFPNDISALRFEWAWQHPQKSKRLRHLPVKRTKEKVYEYKLRILAEMLSVGPWNRLPLILHWLADDFTQDIFIHRVAPSHMPICQGPVKSKKVKQTKEMDKLISKGDKLTSKADELTSKGHELTSKADELFLKKQSPSMFDSCHICRKPMETNELTCLNNKCDLVSHVICLSKCFLQSEQKHEYIPIQGNCPKCFQLFLWGDIIKKSKGCYKELDFDIDANMGNDFYSSGNESD